MRQSLLLVTLGLLLATPVKSQVPVDCPPDLSVPVFLSVPQPCPNQPLHLQASACGPCVDLLGYTLESSGRIRIQAAMNLQNCIITTVCLPETLTVPLGLFAAGHHQIEIVIDGRITRSDSSTCAATRTQLVSFEVPLACGPPPGPLPHVDTIHIGPPAPCATCPPPEICPNLPIPFSIAGRFPDDCYQFRGLELLPNPIMSPLPQPPIARVIVAVNDCMGRPCSLGEIPWQAHAKLPGLPPGAYRMIVEVAEVSWCDTANVPTALYSTTVPFSVAPQCSLPPPSPNCFLADWRHDPGHFECDANIGPGSPAKLVFQINTGPALAGLQGRIALLPPALRVTQLRPIGSASGMQLAWQALPNGAQFVMFSDNGVLIPPTDPCPSNVPCGPLPVLEVTVSAIPGTLPPPLTLARMVELLASDSLGQAVHFCPTFAPVDMVARICGSDRVCDANGDGRVDLRDLVLMVRCLRHPATCPDSLAGRFDCNRDSVFTPDDVLCCARRILHGPLPSNLTPLPLANLRVQLGAPVETSGGFDQSLRVSGADLLAAARLSITLPSGVTLSGVELPGAPAGWLQLSEPGTSEALIGLIALSPDAAAEIDVLLHFNRAASASANAAIVISEAEFVDSEGQVVAPMAGVLGTPERTTVGLELSAARPNPFTRTTHFDLSLVSATDVQLGIYDLSGRLVAKLHRGQLTAGPHTFTWDGTRADGSRAADGVYFYRARAAGQVTARRLVLMRSR
ncbi:MAG: T9SS type A sorting domain-containing protein [Candidatus Eisenbacteria bacterium]|uniref:T9SS type A sorting domain-containing protein n=1 Tax=Eiseniibacteriota bacterium TaxID=2212470 RepID=A0A849SS06_UNCEI|nr:T9SS type A sorting domain-containing protein [Candidatus Eisenbacteria bacterium]